MEAIKPILRGAVWEKLDREGMDRKFKKLPDVWDMTAVAQSRIKVSEADTKESVRYLWKLAEELGMEPVDANPGEIFLRKVPSAKQLCAFIDKSELEGFRVVSCVRI